MSAADYLIRWAPGIVEATAEDIARFGPNAAQVRGLLNFLPTMSDEAVGLSNAAWDAARDVAWPAQAAAWDAAWGGLWGGARGDAWDAARDAAGNAARDAEWDSAGLAARNAVAAEVVSDLITPEKYRILTNPLNVGRTFQERMGLILPDQLGPFMQLIRVLRAQSPEDVLAVARLNSSPNVDALLEMLGGMAEGQPLARRIKAAETLYRAGRGGRGMA